MDVDPVLYFFSGTAMAAAAAYGFARTKYQELLNVELRDRGAQLEKVRADERAKNDASRREAEDALETARKEGAALRKQADDARRDADTAKKEATVLAKEAAIKAVDAMKEEARREATEADRQAALRVERAAQREKTALEKEELVARKEEEIAKREQALRSAEEGVRTTQDQVVKLVSDRRARLEALSGMSGEEARKRLMEDLLDGVRRDSAREAKAIEDLARDEADKKAKRIIGLAIQRFAGDQVQERAVTSIHLPNDDMKGRIIGREGRNIRALQEMCGVDFIVDDTPETIVISGFDPVRREVARLAVESLIKDGRIHPTRIEEAVGQAQEEVDRLIAEAAEQACVELGVTRVHPEITRLLGQLRYRYSYAQNVLKHSLECGYLCGMMAAELGQNEKLARRAGLLHDIGKAVSHEQEGGHAVIGGQIARKFGEDAIVVNGIACHHNDEPAISVIGNLVTASDALSGARPGARREMLEGYVKRLHDLEAISSRFAGVERAFAIQAGREIRVIVEPSEVSDAEAALLAREISKRIEDELSYPGQIRVTVVRETRAVDYAK